MLGVFVAALSPDGAARAIEPPPADPLRLPRAPTAARRRCSRRRGLGGGATAGMARRAATPQWGSRTTCWRCSSRCLAWCTGTRRARTKARCSSRPAVADGRRRRRGAGVVHRAAAELRRADGYASWEMIAQGVAAESLAFGVGARPRVRVLAAGSRSWRASCAGAAGARRSPTPSRGEGAQARGALREALVEKMRWREKKAAKIPRLSGAHFKIISRALRGHGPPRRACHTQPEPNLARSAVFETPPRP